MSWAAEALPLFTIWVGAARVYQWQRRVREDNDLTRERAQMSTEDRLSRLKLTSHRRRRTSAIEQPAMRKPKAAAAAAKAAVRQLGAALGARRQLFGCVMQLGSLDRDKDGSVSR